MEILAGFLIALAIGITGVGAGSITAPILILFFSPVGNGRRDRSTGIQGP